MPFQPPELHRLADSFAHRPPSSLWCGFGTVGDGDPVTILLFAVGDGQRCFLASRFDDGVHELRTIEHALIGQGRSLDDLVALFAG